MNEIVFRPAEQSDQDEIMEIQKAVFAGEQGIPADMLGIDERFEPFWFVAVEGSQIAGTCACWKEDGATHFGRFALKKEYRGKHIGTGFIHYAFQYLFDHGMADELNMECRDVSVHIISAMGGEVTGEPFPLFIGNCTPMILRKEKFI